MSADWSSGEWLKVHMHHYVLLGFRVNSFYFNMPGALGCLKPVVCSWCTPLNKYNIEATHCLSMGDVFTCDSCVQTISVFLWCLFYRWCRCCSTVDLSLLKARAFGNLRERFPVRLWWLPGLSGEESGAVCPGFLARTVLHLVPY